MVKEVRALSGFADTGKKLLKAWDEHGNELSMYIDPDGSMEMRYFKKNGNSVEVFRGMWEDGKLSLYLPSAEEDFNEIW